jgi:hypothetical protein
MKKYSINFYQSYLDQAFENQLAIDRESANKIINKE